MIVRWPSRADREPIFFEAGDQEVYRDLLAEQALKARLRVWAYCLMPNHVHLVVGWALETHLLATLSIAALQMAIDERQPTPGTLVHHSDRGLQYACGDYTAILNAHCILASMSRVGNPYDNAKAESFMKTLKQEEVDGSNYRNVQHARRQIGSFLENTYNRQRLHSALDYRPPVEFEAHMQQRIPGVVPIDRRGFQGIGKSTAINRDGADAPR